MQPAGGADHATDPTPRDGVSDRAAGATPHPVASPPKTTTAAAKNAGAPPRRAGTPSTGTSSAGTPSAGTPSAGNGRKAAAAPQTDIAAPPATGFTPLTTERLTLRPLQPNDAEALHRLVNDWEVTRTLAELPYPYPRELADEWIGSTITRLADGSAYHLAITGHEGEQETLVGVVGLTLDQPARSGRLGYWVGRAYWRHGVATEAAGRLTRWAFANLSLDRIMAEVRQDNEPSSAVLHRIGFSQVGTTTRRSETSDKPHQVRVFQATRDDVFGHPDMPVASTLAVAPGAKPLLLVAACALVDTDGRVLLARRPEGKKMAGLWEFPGGKLDPGETPEAALIRELQEEIGIDVTAACLAPFAFASHAYEHFHLLMPLYLCRRWKGTPTPRENQTLAWVRAQKLTEYDMPPADKPLIPLLRDFL